MNRRDALCRLMIISGGIMLSNTSWLQATASTNKIRSSLTAADIPLLDEIGETILPTTTTTPGAKASRIGAYMVAMVNDCFNKARRTAFIEGLNTFDKTCQEKYKKAFLQLTKEQKKVFLKQLDTESKLPLKSAANEVPLFREHYFAILKQLTISGYFSSEVGATKALRYVAVPGRYEGCKVIKAGDRPWAT